MSRLNIVYRISEESIESRYAKNRPHYINNKNCFTNAVKIFNPISYNWLVVADNISTDTNLLLEQYLEKNNIIHVNTRNGAKTFNIALDYTVKFSDEDYVYFLENDYLHLSYADQILIQGLKSGYEYVTLYDHPDKYLPPNAGGNPFINKDGSEDTKVFITNNIHWKITNSTTGTFASSVKNIKEDEKTLRKWTTGNHFDDFKMFLELGKNGKRLISCMPGFSTHGQIPYLTPFIDWEKTI